MGSARLEQVRARSPRQKFGQVRALVGGWAGTAVVACVVNSPGAAGAAGVVDSAGARVRVCALTFIGKMYIYTPKPNICWVWCVFFYMFFQLSFLTPNDSL